MTRIIIDIAIVVVAVFGLGFTAGHWFGRRQVENDAIETENGCRDENGSFLWNSNTVDEENAVHGGGDQ